MGGVSRQLWGPYANHDGDGNRNAGKKDLMARTRAKHACIKTSEISQPSSTKQQREIARICVV